MQEHKDEDRGRALNLPMGGLLSELLASEGIDAGGMGENPGPPVHTAMPAAAQAPPPAPSPHSEPAIALPGLLSDLLNLAAGAAEAAEALPAPAPRPDQARTPQTELPRPAAAVETGLAGQAEAHEPPALAIPGLLSLLSAGEEGEAEAACSPAMPEAAIREGEAQAVKEAAAAMTAGDGGWNEPSLDELEIDDLSEPETGALPESASEVAAPPAVEEIQATHEAPAAAPVACGDLAGDLDAGVGESPIAADAVESVVAAGPEILEPEAGREPEYSPDHAAAALAEAAGRLVIEAAGRSGESPAAALADLMSVAGGVSPAGLDEDASPPPEACERYVVFHLAGHSYGLHITSVREVEKAGRVTPVPGAPPMMQGLINLHGEILPLIDPSPLLALPAREGASGGYLVVVRNSGQDGDVAWRVDGLGGMALVDRERIAAPGGEGPEDGAGCVAATGTARHRGRRLILLDARRLASEEAIELAAGGWTARPEVGL